jgi:hypothetical protein
VFVCAASAALRACGSCVPSAPRTLAQLVAAWKLHGSAAVHPDHREVELGAASAQAAADVLMDGDEDGVTVCVSGTPHQYLPPSLPSLWILQSCVT